MALAAALGLVPAAAPAGEPGNPQAPQATGGQLGVVEVDRTDTSTVIVVEKKKAEPDPAWAYPDRGLTFFPEGPGKGKDRWAVGGILQVAPMFQASYRRGLGSGFSVDARLSTIILYNQLGVGGQWGVKTGPFTLGLMLHVDGFFGTLGKAFLMSSQFNAMGWGVLVSPGVKAGLQVASDTWLTAVWEAYGSVYQAQDLGGTVISPGSSLYEGWGLTFVAEYAPEKQKGVIYYGASLYNTRSNYPLWFNVDYSPKFIWYIGVLAGYEF